MKKTIITTLIASALSASIAFAAIPGASSQEGKPVSFLDVTPQTYAEYWEDGQSFKSNGNQEYPDLFGRQWRKAFTNSISLVTPRMIVSYISFSGEKRLLDIPADFESIMEKYNDLVYVATWTNFSRDGSNALLGGGAITPQLPTQRLVIDKDGTIIRPVPMPEEIENLMPHSFGLVYYAFPRSVILNVPYTIRWVNGYGNILSMEVPDKLIRELADDEFHFYNSNKGVESGFILPNKK
ncbi:hypothetical protein [uncultured Dialister sp.]|uniref:hypothetical protein n=1 Tax=uncultured Dialister sp. TaxID=278064 RepID=UPI002614D32F|nr:hypothetical protein [uncultured Dialister sp.]